MRINPVALFGQNIRLKNRRRATAGEADGEAAAPWSIFDVAHIYRKAARRIPLVRPASRSAPVRVISFRRAGVTPSPEATASETALRVC